MLSKLKITKHLLWPDQFLLDPFVYLKTRYDQGPYPTPKSIVWAMRSQKLRYSIANRPGSSSSVPFCQQKGMRAAGLLCSGLARACWGKAVRQPYSPKLLIFFQFYFGRKFYQCFIRKCKKKVKHWEGRLFDRIPASLLLAPKAIPLQGTP